MVFFKKKGIVIRLIDSDLDRGERGEVPIERGGGGPDVRDGGRVLVRAPRDEALVGLDVEEEQHIADVRARGVPGAVPERGVLGGEHGRERAERERRLLLRDLQRLRQRRGAHAPAGARRGRELLLELREGLRQRALREDELGDGQEAVLERLPPRAEQRRGGGGRRRRRRGRVRRRVEGLVGHRGDAREEAWGEGRSGSARGMARRQRGEGVTRCVRAVFFFFLSFRLFDLKGSLGFPILVSSRGYMGLGQSQCTRFHRHFMNI